VNIKIKFPEQLIVHDVLEYTFKDLMQEFSDEEEAGQHHIVLNLMWAKGVAMFVEQFANPSYFVEDEKHGILHFRRVLYAMKEKFEKRIIIQKEAVESGRVIPIINLIDQEEIPLYSDLAEELKRYSKWKKKQITLKKNLKKVEKYVGKLNDNEYEFFRAGRNLGLSAQQITDQLKEIKTEN
tara:strand:- start:158 stop:703 length:546 start_codon:yes stop_codon:yes gene_type:complete